MRVPVPAFLPPLLAVLLWLGGAATHAATPLEVPEGVSLPDVVAPLLPAVVNVTVIKAAPPAKAGALPADPLAPAPQRHEFGSGFIIDPAGYIVTNRHVIDGADRVTVTFDDNTVVPARVVSTNARPDLALLKVEVARQLPTVHFGDSDAIRVGQTVVAIGNPLGLSSSISVGVVSALNRDLNETMIDDFIQTDAAINHGNSGGPLFNLKGEVIGVNWALIAPTGDSGSAGLGLAIPANDASFVVDQMLHDGRFNAGFIGLRLQQLTPDVAEVVGLKDGAGGIVAAILPHSPAELAGIRLGDVILEFDHRRAKDVRALLRVTGATRPGTTVPMLILRDSQQMTVQMTVTGWPSGAVEFDPAGVQEVTQRPAQAVASLGLNMAALTDAVRVLRALPPTQKGVLVMQVAPNTLGSDAGIDVGDFILQVRADTVSTPQDVTDRLAAARREGLSSVLLLVQTGDRPHWVPLKVPAS